MNRLFPKIFNELKILYNESLSLRRIPDVSKLGFGKFILLTWFGIGLVKPMSATWGSLAAIPFGYAILIYFGALELLFCIVTLFFLEIRAIETQNRYLDMNYDPSIVIDEVIGMWLVGLFAGPSIIAWGIAFILFRVFDIIKPWPAFYFDKQQSGSINVILDDLVAAIYAVIALELLLYFF